MESATLPVPWSPEVAWKLREPRWAVADAGAKAGGGLALKAMEGASSRTAAT